MQGFNFILCLYRSTIFGTWDSTPSAIPYLQDFVVEGESGDGDSRDDHGSRVGEHDLTDDVSVRLVEYIRTFQDQINYTQRSYRCHTTLSNIPKSLCIFVLA